MNNMNTLKTATWNIRKGGFSEYDLSESVPPKEDRIKSVISTVNPDALTLTDVFRWNTHYGGDEGIARHLGMKAAFYTPLDDEYLNRGNPEHSWQLGIVFATNKKVADSENIDIGGRQANRTILDIGKYGIQYVSAYFNHDDEDIRTAQAEALIAQLEDVPTIVEGNFNMERPLEVARLSTRARSNIIRLAAMILPAGEAADTFHQLERREALNVLLNAGLVDGDPRQQPTAYGKLQIFSTDYIMSRGEGMSVSDVKALPHQGGSDHRILTGTVHYQ